MDCRLVLDARAVIGESPTWSAAEQALYWIDVKAPALFRLDPGTGAQSRWDLDGDIGGFALCADGLSALVALRDGLYRLVFRTGTRTRLAPAPFDQSLFRFNEGGCDGQGRFWIGVMFDPVGKADQPEQVESLYVYTEADGLRPAPDRSSLHNGMVWSADGRQMFLSHSNEQSVFRFDYDPGTGRFGGRTLFARIDPADGLPDGAALDTEGGYWCALHGGWALRRFHADGRHDRDVRLPVQQPTMCAFGGWDLGTLFVTSAADKLDASALAAQPHAGGLFALRPDIAGQPRPVVAFPGPGQEPSTRRSA